MIAVNATQEEEGQMLTLVTKRLSEPRWGFNWGFTGASLGSATSSS